jgi:hypothetical protein
MMKSSSKLAVATIASQVTLVVVGVTIAFKSHYFILGAVLIAHSLFIDVELKLLKIEESNTHIKPVVLLLVAWLLLHYLVFPDLHSESNQNIYGEHKVSTQIVNARSYALRKFNVVGRNASLGTDDILQPAMEKLRRGNSGNDSTSNSTHSKLHVLKPRGFPLDGLNHPADGMFNKWLQNSGLIAAENLEEPGDAVIMLCIASFGLDLSALKYLLWDLGVSADGTNPMDGNRNALHCLSSVVRYESDDDEDVNEDDGDDDDVNEDDVLCEYR